MLVIEVDKLEPEEKAVWEIMKRVEMGEINADQGMEELLSMIDQSEDNHPSPV
jgi:hypothetical protein